MLIRKNLDAYLSVRRISLLSLDRDAALSHPVCHKKQKAAKSTKKEMILLPVSRAYQCTSLPSSNYIEFVLACFASLELYPEPFLAKH